MKRPYLNYRGGVLELSLLITRELLTEEKTS